MFEQSYGGVEGDSASIAEFCALISAIANIPIKQSLAVTGSLNQHGQAQAIGGINQKIEGYFAICSARGLTGHQGVLMPQANIQHLMLKQDVIDAVEKGMFHIYAVQSIDDALTLLMGMPAGEEQADGSYPNNSINARVMAQVDEWIALTKEFSAHSDENDDHDDKN
ncbi:ATP-dependent protease La Type II [gamma proteobacterium IMCC2047]|nr:ATP-dependent protease La Type II [gamma proteobacterium IMCC2047]